MTWNDVAVFAATFAVGFLLHKAAEAVNAWRKTPPRRPGPWGPPPPIGKRPDGDRG